ncbi:hypothetical protein [Aequorivita sp. KMM 9714]|uniref:hypothetical protein n=1 Tax=Aequorivita sp. KMM 9714 TaxID=2707173 RepID=UPI0013ED3E8A|nr:hypothetical protein [Aequorivita sp. KMM 9714]NGX85336.1 hypothetical protein [Aequorivita sp. KMM 9714]
MKTLIIKTFIKASEILKGCKLDLEKIEADQTIHILNRYFGTTTTRQTKNLSSD